MKKPTTISKESVSEYRGSSSNFGCVSGYWRRSRSCSRKKSTKRWGVVATSVRKTAVGIATERRCCTARSKSLTSLCRS